MRKTIELTLSEAQEMYKQGGWMRDKALSLYTEKQLLEASHEKKLKKALEKYPIGTVLFDRNGNLAITTNAPYFREYDSNALFVSATSVPYFPEYRMDGEQCSINTYPLTVRLDKVWNIFRDFSEIDVFFTKRLLNSLDYLRTSKEIAQEDMEKLKKEISIKNDVIEKYENLLDNENKRKELTDKIIHNIGKSIATS